MRLPQVVVYDYDGRLAALLRPLAERQVWALREPRQVGACLRLLPGGEPCVLVLRVARDLEREFTLLHKSRLLAPEAACVVVIEADHPGLVGLAWDLGAAAVLTPPRMPGLGAAVARGFPGEALLEVVAALMAEPALGGPGDDRTAPRR